VAKSLNAKERELFLSLSLPMIKETANEGIKGRLLFALRKRRVSDVDIKEAFPEELKRLNDTVLREKPLFGFLDKRNYIFDYYFKYHNNEKKCRVVPALIIGFKAERRNGINVMIVKVRYPDGTVDNESVEVFPGIDFSINLNDHVLTHNKTVCCKITSEEYKFIVANYFSQRAGGTAK